jgi:hypothetical protein
MSLGNNPSIVTNGLIFYYDMNNPSSYRSPALKNILTEITPRGQGSSSTYQFSNGTENVYIPNLGFIPNCAYMDMYNDYNGGSNNCCPSPYGYGNSLVVSPSTFYTYAIVYKSVNGYTNANYMYHYEFTSGGSYLTEYGVFGNNGSTAKLRLLGDDWYWASSTFTSNASAGLMNTGSWMYEYARYNRFYVAKAMIVAGNYIDMHPKFWPALNTTVSNTQALVDLTVQNTITASSLTYNSDGTFSFNGSSNYLSWGSTSMSNFTSGVTLEAWVNMNASGTQWTRIYDFGAGQNIDNLLLCQYSTTNDLAFYIIVGSTQYYLLASSAITNNQTAHFVATANGGNWFIYKNGIQVATQASSVLPANVTRNSNYIGKSNWADPYLNGSVYNAKIYNRALSPSEVAQNFAAQRGLYGI